MHSHVEEKQEYEDDRLLSYLRAYLFLPDLRYEDITFFTMSMGERTFIYEVKVTSPKRVSGWVGDKLLNNVKMSWEQIIQQLTERGSKPGTSLLRRRIR